MVFAVNDDRRWRVRLPAGSRVGAAAWAPRGDRIALAVRQGSSTSVYVTPSALVPRRPVFTTTGTLRSLAWSPNGRRLLVRWSEADQWLLLSPTAANARDHRDRRHLAALRQRTSRAGLVLLLS